MLMVKFSLLQLRCALPQWVACLGCSLWGGVTMASVIAFNTILVSQLQVRQLGMHSKKSFLVWLYNLILGHGSLL